MSLNNDNIDELEQKYFHQERITFYFLQCNIDCDEIVVLEKVLNSF